MHRLIWISAYDTEWTPIEYLVKSEADFDLLIAYAPPAPVIDVRLIQRARQAIGEHGITAPWVQGAFNYVAFDLRSLEDLMLDALEHPEFFHRLMRVGLDRNKQIIAQYLDAGPDMLSYAGNVASGKMIGVSLTATENLFSLNRVSSSRTP